MRKKLIGIFVIMLMMAVSTLSIATKINKDEIISNDKDTQSIGYSVFIWTVPTNCKITLKKDNNIVGIKWTNGTQTFSFAGFCSWEGGIIGKYQVCVENDMFNHAFIKKVDCSRDGKGIMVFFNLFSIPIPRIFWPIHK